MGRCYNVLIGKFNFYFCFICYNGNNNIAKERKNREKYSFFNKISPNICNEIIFYNNCIQYDFTVFFINFKLKENNNGKTISIKSACS